MSTFTPAMTAALSEAWRSAGNHRENALKLAIRQAETPRPISARPPARANKLSLVANMAQPSAAMTSRLASTLRGP